MEEKKVEKGEILEVEETGKQVSQLLDLEAVEEVTKSQSGRKKLEKIVAIPSYLSVIKTVSISLMSNLYLYRILVNYFLNAKVY
jgi:hypothetical protein